MIAGKDTRLEPFFQQKLRTDCAGGAFLKNLRFFIEKQDVQDRKRQDSKDDFFILLIMPDSAHPVL